MTEDDTRLKEIHDLLWARAVEQSRNIVVNVCMPRSEEHELMSFSKYKIKEHLKACERESAIKRTFEMLTMPSFSDVKLVNCRPVNKVLCRDRTDPLVLEALDIIMRKKDATENQLMKAWKTNWLRDPDDLCRRIDNVKIAENIELLESNTTVESQGY